MASHKTAVNNKKNNNNKDGVIKELRNLFGGVLHIDIIKSVAASFNYDLHLSTSWLLELSGNVDGSGDRINHPLQLSAPTTPKQKNTNKSNPNNNNKNVGSNQKTNGNHSNSNIANNSNKKQNVGGGGGATSKRQQGNAQAALNLAIKKGNSSNQSSPQHGVPGIWQHGAVNRPATAGSNQPIVRYGGPLKLSASSGAISSTTTGGAAIGGANNSPQHANKEMSKKAERIEQAVVNIQSNYKVLVLLRGLPGSGKSFLGRHILYSAFGPNAKYEEHLLSTDDFFSQNDGRYIYNHNRLQEAHDWNHRRAFNAMTRGLSPVIIDNTNVQMWEMKPYAGMATDYGYLIQILEPDTWWSFNDKELTRRNTHNVSKMKIREMLDRYDKNVTVQKLMQSYNLSYKFQKPPQFRVTPPFRSRPAENNNDNKFIAEPRTAAALPFHVEQPNNNSVGENDREAGGLSPLRRDRRAVRFQREQPSPSQYPVGGGSDGDFFNHQLDGESCGQLNQQQPIPLPYELRNGQYIGSGILSTVGPDSAAGAANFMDHEDRSLVKSKSISALQDSPNFMQFDQFDSQSHEAAATTAANTETINLMDFNDDFQENVKIQDDFLSTTSAPTDSLQDDNNSRTSASFWEIVNPVDKILMCGNSDDEDDTNGTGGTIGGSNDYSILQPDQVTKAVSGELAWSCDGANNKNSDDENPFDDVNLENAWGVDERALQSWDIVTPLKQGADDKKPTTSGAAKMTSNFWDSNRSFELVAPNWGADSNTTNNITAPTTTTTLYKLDGSTCMESIDMQLMTTSEIPENLPANFRVMRAQHRDINVNTLFSKYNSFYRKKNHNNAVMVDRSCLTDDILDATTVSDHRDQASHLKELKNLFQHIPRAYLKELYEKCNKDFNWTVNVLLDDDKHYSIDRQNQVESEEDNENQEPHNSEEQQEQTQHNPGTMETGLQSGGKPAEQMGYVSSDTSDDGDANTREFKAAFKRKHIQSDETLRLKQCLEQKFDISNEHYSEHVLKVKQYKFGGTLQQQQQQQSVTTATPSYGGNTIENYHYNSNATAVQDDSQQPCSSTSAFTPPFTQPSGSGRRRRYRNRGNRNGSSDSDTDSDVDNQGAVGGVVTRHDFDEDNPKNLVELNLGEAFVAQLEMKFGTMSGGTTAAAMGLPEGFQPVVQLPVKLARQLYAFYMESVCQQMESQNSIMEQLVKEDEEFARKLQAQEHQQQSSTFSSAHNNRPTQSQTTLTSTGASGGERSLTFTEIMDEQMAHSIHRKDIERQWKSETADNLAARLTRQKLFEIFPNMKQDLLIEILHAYGNDYNKTVEDVVASVGIEDINQMAVIKEPPLSQTALEEMRHDEAGCKDEDTMMSEETKPATYYRERANEHLLRRQELYNKAMAYSQKGQTEVAMFYSLLAQKETTFYDKANNMAAQSFLQQNFSKLDTIDLHYLYVKEAIPALDVFIDRNINLLIGGRKLSENLFVITGRGKRSDGGKSKIKPAVIARLRKRNIGYIEMNPGLLKIKVTRNSSVTSNLP